MSIPTNIAMVRERTESAARRAGRVPKETPWWASLRPASPREIVQLLKRGRGVFGENRVQEFAGKAAALADLVDTKWHMIGHLQTNKASRAAELFAVVDSIDSLKLAEKLNAAAENLGKKLAVLIEINVGGEAAKSGLGLDSPEIDEILLDAPRLRSFLFQQFITFPPFTDDPQGARPYFQKLRGLRDAIARRRLPSVSMNVLSMGMSHDFEVAIEEGSTCVRLGAAIFGERVKA